MHKTRVSTGGRAYCLFVQLVDEALLYSKIRDHISSSNPCFALLHPLLLFCWTSRWKYFFGLLETKENKYIETRWPTGPKMFESSFQVIKNREFGRFFPGSFAITDGS